MNFLDIYRIFLQFSTTPEKTSQTVLLCGGPGGGFGGPGGGFRGFLARGESSGFATTETTEKKTAKTTTRTATKQNCLVFVWTGRNSYKFL